MPRARMMVMLWLASVGGALAAPTPTEKRIPELIGGLSAADPAARALAARQLRELGGAARPALLAAARSEDPELRWQAAQLLLDLPWYRPDDPPAARQILADYGKGDEQKRKQDLTRLYTSLRDGAGEILLRLLAEEPSDAVRWSIVPALRGIRRQAFLQRLRQIDPPPDNAALLTLVGSAWMGVDNARCLALFRRVAELETARPVAEASHLEIVFDVLVGDDVAHRRFDEAARWRRRQAGRGSPGGYEIPPPVLGLFALHARFGPLEDFAQDLHLYRAYLGRPQILYALGHLHERGGHHLLAQACYRTAFLAGLSSQQLHYDAGDFLMDQGWLDLAELELAAVLRFEGPAKSVYDANARFRLSRLAVLRNDDFNAAEHLRQAMEAVQQTQGALLNRTTGGESRPLPEKEVWGEIHWRYFRAARVKKDQDEMDKHLAKLLELLPGDGTVAMDVVPTVREMGRSDDAAKLFTPAYTAARAELDADPLNPEPMNNLAWLCARCDERLDEALELAKRAVSLAPDNYAYLDTLAEANFRLGNVDEAIKLEERALELHPGDTFMEEQLARFRAGRKPE